MDPFDPPIGNKCEREVMLMFDVGQAVGKVCEYSDFSDGICLARAAIILRRDLFKIVRKSNGSLTDDFNWKESVSLSPLNFVSILVGAG
jgi:hypothetical protein